MKYKGSKGGTYLSMYDICAHKWCFPSNIAFCVAVTKLTRKIGAFLKMPELCMQCFPRVQSLFVNAGKAFAKK